MANRFHTRVAVVAEDIGALAAPEAAAPAAQASERQRLIALARSQSAQSERQRLIAIAHGEAAYVVADGGPSERQRLIAGARGGATVSERQRLIAAAREGLDPANGATTASIAGATAQPAS